MKPIRNITDAMEEIGRLDKENEALRATLDRIEGELRRVENIPVYGWGDEACAQYAGAVNRALIYLESIHA